MTVSVATALAVAVTVAVVVMVLVVVVVVLATTERAATTIEVNDVIINMIVYWIKRQRYAL